MGKVTVAKIASATSPVVKAPIVKAPVAKVKAPAKAEPEGSWSVGQTVQLLSGEKSGQMGKIVEVDDDGVIVTVAGDFTVMSPADLKLVTPAATNVGVKRPATTAPGDETNAKAPRTSAPTTPPDAAHKTPVVKAPVVKAPVVKRKAV